jgi:hypothetical protein
MEMRMPGLVIWGAAALAIAVLSVPNAWAQQAISLPADAEREVRAADAAYWAGYNGCNAAAMADTIAEDVEFYHDKGGVTRSRKALVDSVMVNICGTAGVHVRREADPDIRFEPIPGYGAVLSGGHRFYMAKAGGPERETGTARFVALWHYDGTRWLMSRVFSLDHEAVEYHPPASGVVLSAAQLERYAGRYRMEKSGEAEVTVANGALVLTSGGLRVTLAAKTPDHFFALERDLQFDFSGAKDGKAGALTVIENGAPVETGTRAD